MDNKIKNRGWVKTATIIFLAVMLVLTFFSNTIMNYSLPQVSAQYTSYGTINSKVTGSGIVEAGDVYQVKAQSTREIKGVSVRVGDTVEQGQTLFLLEGGDSAELEAAQKAFDDANYTYQKALLSADGSNNYSAELLEIAQLEAELAEAKTKQQISQQKYNDFLAELDPLNITSATGKYAQKAIQAAQLKNQLDDTSELYLSAKNKAAEIQRQIGTAQAEFYKKNSEFKAIDNQYNLALNQKNNAEQRLDTASKRAQELESEITEYVSAPQVSASSGGDKQIEALKADYAGQIAKVAQIEAQIKAMENELPALQLQVFEKQELVFAAKAPLISLKAKLDTAQNVYDTALEALNDAKEAYNNIKSNIPKSSEALAADIKAAERSLDALKLELKYLKQTIRQDSSADKLADLNEAYNYAYAEYKSAQRALREARNNPDIDKETIQLLETEAAYAGEAYRAALLEYEAAVTDEDRKTNTYDKELAAKELQIRNSQEDLDALVIEYEEALKSEVMLNAAQKVIDERAIVADQKRELLAKVKDEYNPINYTCTALEGELSSAQAALDDKNASLEGTKSALEFAQQELKKKRALYLDALDNTQDAPVAIEVLNTELLTEMATIKEMGVIIQEAQAKLDELSPALEVARDALAQAQSMLDTEKSYIEAENSYIADYEQKYDTYISLKGEIDTQRTTLAQEAVAAKSSALSLEKTLQNVQHSLNTKKAQDIANGKLQNLELSNQKRELDNLKEKLDLAKNNSQSSEIKAKYAGVVSSINISAGQQADPSQILAEIQLVERGFVVSFGCTAQQASTLKAGEVAEIRNIWSYGTEAVLESIKNDPSNPGKMKILTFKITGDVSPGQNLNLSVGSKSQNFEHVVPNTAIREDSKGKFILTVVSKQSPLGNRYIATRTNIEVLSSDDTSTAISGALHGNEFVITSSSKPISPGQQVKLVEEGA